MVNDLLIQEQYEELRARFDRLNLQKCDDGQWHIQGILGFSAEYSGQCIEDEYSIEIMVPDDYPKMLPGTRETANRIPTDFHRNKDETLCLGAPLAVRAKFEEEPTLRGYITNCLIPFLYSFSYKCQYGNMPFGELSHGGKGILEYYRELFHLDDDRAILRLIRLLAEDKYRGHLSCPCGSGKRLRSCHGSKLLEIKKLQKPSDF